MEQRLRSQYRLLYDLAIFELGVLPLALAKTYQVKTRKAVFEKNLSLFRYAYAVAVGMLLSSSIALACPEGQYEVCFGPCVCVTNSAELGQGDTFPFQEEAMQLAAPALQAWLIQSRNDAIRSNTSPIPTNIRTILLRWYSAKLLDSVRCKVGDNGILNTAHTLMQNENVEAVTLIDLIVFRNQTDALNNVALWAHEMQHVKQFAEWGVRDFSIRYVHNFNEVESPAYEIQSKVAVARRGRAVPTN